MEIPTMHWRRWPVESKSNNTLVAKTVGELKLGIINGWNSSIFLGELSSKHRAIGLLSHQYFRSIWIYGQSMKEMKVVLKDVAYNGPFKYNYSLNLSSGPIIIYLPNCREERAVPPMS